MFYGALCDTIWVIGCIPAALAAEKPDSTSFFLTNGFIIFINMFVNILDGCSSPLLWVANGVYIADCATEKNKGFYFSYFMVYYLAAGIFGNLISAFVLEYLKQSEFFLIMAGIDLIGATVLAFMKDPII